ncbi:MAG: HypC/HybG/HupF family hydrogenase formation chaperone [Bacteroidota bacterium]|nr:HypC/HybG/HupF family hydrogenase formation chaperone [Bacteroidota bacterium]
MCLAVPGKIVSIDTSNPDLRMAKVSFGGVIKEICVQWLPEAGIGDYVLAHVGMALNKLDEEEARLSLEAFEEMDRLLKEEDGMKPGIDH